MRISDWSSDVCSSDLRARHRHLHREPGIQPAGRRPARLARSQERRPGMSEGQGTAKPLLAVEDLQVSFPSRKGLVEAVRGVSFSLGREKLGIVGESGSGKSMTGRAILRLVSKPGIVRAKRLEFDGIDLQRPSEEQRRRNPGQRISMVMQDPKFSLNPVMRVGEQIAEAYRTHQKVSHA